MLSVLNKIKDHWKHVSDDSSMCVAKTSLCLTSKNSGHLSLLLCTFLDKCIYVCTSSRVDISIKISILLVFVSLFIFVLLKKKMLSKICILYC